MLAFIPFDSIFVFSNGYSSLIKLLKLQRLLRMSKIGTIINNITKFISINSGYLTLIIMFFKILIIIHYAAIIWFYIGDTSRSNNYDNWIDDYF